MQGFIIVHGSHFPYHVRAVEGGAESVSNLSARSSVVLGAYFVGKSIGPGVLDESYSVI